MKIFLTFRPFWGKLSKINSYIKSTDKYTKILKHIILKPSTLNLKSLRLLTSKIDTYEKFERYQPHSHIAAINYNMPQVRWIVQALFTRDF